MASLLNNGRNRRYMGGFQNGIRSVPLVLAFAIAGYFIVGIGKADTLASVTEAETGVLAGNYEPGDTVGASAGVAVRFGGGGINWPATTNRPPQPMAFIYDDPPTNTLDAYAQPGALVVAGRTGYDNQKYKNISAAGGSVLIYLDVLIDAKYGDYHAMLLDASQCGPAVPRWPGEPKANEWGYLNDFRPGSVVQQKLQCVLEKMVADNPHMAGWFADDVGSRSWYPDINWDSWSPADKQAYRDGAVEIVKTFRKVADEHGLIFVVNGTWSGGTLEADGGGYPDMSQTGNALADGGVVEHHPVSELPYFKNYACAPQWATQSPITKGKSLMVAINNTAAEMQAYRDSGCYAYLTIQSEYGQAPTPWGEFHPNGLPNKTGAKVVF